MMDDKIAEIKRDIAPMAAQIRELNSKKGVFCDGIINHMKDADITSIKLNNESLKLRKSERQMPVNRDVISGRINEALLEHARVSLEPDVIGQLVSALVDNREKKVSLGLRRTINK